jgi:hypothetical protein
VDERSTTGTIANILASLSRRETKHVQREATLAQNFEIPQQVRELAENNVRAAQTAYVQLMDAMSQAVTMWSTSMPSNDITSGFKTLQDRATQIAKQNADAAFALASDIASAKDVQQVLALQSRFAQTQMQAYTMQAQELGRIVMESANAARR